MTTSPYDTLPTGKQVLAPTSGESIEEKPNPITDPYGGYEEISLEEAARLATPVISQSQDSGSSPAVNRNSGDPGSAKPVANRNSGDPGSAKPAANRNSGDSGSAKPAASQPASAPDTAMKKVQPAASALTDTQFGDVNNTSNTDNAGNAGSTGTASGSASLPAESLLDAELHYDNIRLRNRRRTWNYTLPFDETLLVPDTMPDMIQILFSEGRVTPSQPGKAHYSSSDTYSGEILLFTVYRPDGGEGTPVDVVRSTITFETSACWGTSGSQNTSTSQADSDRIYYATVCLKEVEPSRLNERKFQVRGTLCIAVTEIQKTELHVLRDSSDKNLILKQEKKEAADLVFETEEFADIEQEIAVEEGQPQPVRILKESFTITETHRQVSSGKLIINGLLQVQILYLGEDDERENQLCCRREKTEFTQFIPLQSQLNSDLIKVDFSGDGLKLTIENQDTFQLEGQVRIRILGYGSKQIPVASDAYHKEKSIHFDRKVEALSCLTDVLSGEISAREVVNLTQQDQHPEKLICGSILPGNISVHPEHGRIVIEGSVPVRILSLDENGRAFVIKSEVPLRGALNTSASPEALQEADLFTCSAIKDFWIDTINSRQIEINVNATIEVWISETREFTSLEHFTARGEDPQQPAMTIYITSAGDSLWDVAKHYQCDADALVQLNQIDGDAPLAEGAKLLIVR
ncbi:MAG: SPOCS domain-containing protein [Clostridia bacterium]